MRNGLLFFFSLTLICASATGCEAVSAENESLGDAGVTFSNQTDRPFAIIAFEEELSHRIDPLPALPEEEFEKQRVGVSSSYTPEEISGYEKGDGLFVLVYAKCADDCTVSEQVIENWGRNAAPMVHSFRLSAGESEEKNYQITIEELSRFQ